jgi:hypothetical protein
MLIADNWLPAMARSLDRSPAELGVAFSEVVMPFAHVSGYSLHNITGVKENNRLS